MHSNKISLPLTHSIQSSLIFFFIFQFIQPAYVYSREERVPYTKKSAEEVPDPTDQKLLKLKCSLCAQYTYNIHTRNATAHNLFTFCWIHRFKICIFFFQSV